MRLSPVSFGRFAGSIALVVSLGLLLTPLTAQNRSTRGPFSMATTSRPQADVDWPLHSFDIRSSRFAPLGQINVSNVGQLAVKWSARIAGNIGEETPVVANGLMFFNVGSKLFALNAATGEPVWTFEAPLAFAGGGRGPAYGDGRVYAFGPSVIYAVDAKSGTAVASFGDKGLLRIVNKALEFKYPGRYPADLDSTKLGYSMTTPPMYWNGTLYVGLPFADSLVPGAFLVAADGATGAIKWVFNTVPQSPADDGWAAAEKTWSRAERYGGGIWTQPSIDPELGMIYFNASNPSPNYDGSSRRGSNLFTNSVIALSLETGKLQWYYQTLHHDIWDWDLDAGPILFDITTPGATVKGLASFGKSCYGYFLDRRTGKPLNPIVETSVPVQTDVPGEEVSPTQPIPYTSRAVPQQPFCATYPVVSDPDLASRVRPMFHPYQANEFVIVSPGLTGGANYGPPSFSPATHLVYITGKNDASSIKVKPVGDTLKPGPGNQGHYAVLAGVGKAGVTPRATVTAYDPISGDQAWHAELAGSTNSGNLVTAGGVLFQGLGNGDFHALNAKTGKPLFTTRLGNAIRASPITYQTGGRQFVAVLASNTVIALGLADQTKAASTDRGR
jgi:PQQ-dependent dehydrogenase (methanol/ethanol family)